MAVSTTSDDSTEISKVMADTDFLALSGGRMFAQGIERFGMEQYSDFEKLMFSHLILTCLKELTKHPPQASPRGESESCKALREYIESEGEDALEQLCIGSREYDYSANLVLRSVDFKSSDMAKVVRGIIRRRGGVLNNMLEGAESVSRSGTVEGDFVFLLIYDWLRKEYGLY